MEAKWVYMGAIWHNTRYYGSGDESSYTFPLAELSSLLHKAKQFYTHAIVSAKVVFREAELTTLLHLLTHTSLLFGAVALTSPISSKLLMTIC